MFASVHFVRRGRAPKVRSRYPLGRDTKQPLHGEARAGESFHICSDDTAVTSVSKFQASKWRAVATMENMENLQNATIELGPSRGSSFYSTAVILAAIGPLLYVLFSRLKEYQVRSYSLKFESAQFVNANINRAMEC